MSPALRQVPWRSLLYVPATEQRFVHKAAGVGADAVQLDLEDSIAPSRKEAARSAVPDAVDHLVDAGVEVVVRVNHPARLLVRDLEVCARPGVSAVAVPKLEHAQQVMLVDEVLTELELERGLPVGGIGLIGMIETTAGLLEAPGIARSTHRLIALTAGTEDFALSAGIRPEPDLMAGVLQQTVLAARASGLWPLGLAGSLAGFNDLGQFRHAARRARRLGCVGAAAIHPSQVPVLNQEFTPSADEVEQARKLLFAYDEAAAQGQGAIAVDGRMVDAPVVGRARALLRTADRYQARDVLE